MIIQNVQVLRGIAVILVLLFHLEVEAFKFGYLGVDVFFLISGFLMPIIITKYDAIGYIKARFNRLFPALLAVVLFSLIVGYILLMPGEYKSLAFSALTALSFSSEFYFIFNTGYFDINSELQPLLHTWSLGNEFLGYLIVFGFLLLFSKNKARVFSLSMVIVTAIYILFNPTFNYFDPIPRLFLFFLGFYFSTYRKEINLNDKLLILISLIALTVFIYFFGQGIVQSKWPSYGIFLLPLFILPLFILKTQLLPTKILNQVFYKAGDWSYSIYLWHWPIIVFERIYLRNSGINTKEAIIMFFLAIIMGAFSYYFIERKTKIALPGFALSLTLIMFIFFTAGASFRVAPDMHKYTSIDKMRDKSEKQIYQFKDLEYVEISSGVTKNKTLVIGDSHSQHILPFYKAGYDGSIFRLKHPHSIIDSWPYIIELINQLKTDTILISYRFHKRDKQEVKGLLTLLNELSNRKKIVIVRDIPSMNGDPVACLIARNSDLFFKDCGFDIASGLPIEKVFNKDNENWSYIELNSNKNIDLINTHKSLCNMKSCKTIINNEFIMRDNNHLNERLSIETNKRLFEILFQSKSLDKAE